MTQSLNDLLGFTNSRECFQIGQTRELNYKGRIFEVHRYSGSISIKDLTDAGKAGKTVVVLTLQYWKDERSSCEVLYWDFEEIFNVLTGILPVDDFCICSDFESIKVYRSVNKAIRYMAKDLSVYKPLTAKPKKWTLTHAIRAIINGQYKNLSCNGRYTDDYAWDAAVNFDKGNIKNALAFIKKVIEHPSGWRVNEWDDNGIIHIDCHSFDNNSFEFDLQGKRQQAA